MSNDNVSFAPGTPLPEILAGLRWTADGLIPAIIQDVTRRQVLMMGWMNATSLALTIEERRTVFWSRSRRTLWRKGETSGHVQWVRRILHDCDADVLLIEVEQVAAACHTGAVSCFDHRIIWEATA